TAQVRTGPAELPVRRTHRGDLDEDPDLVPEEEAAALERLLPGEPEVLSVDRAAGPQADTVVPPRVALGPLDHRLQLDLAGRIPDREVAEDAEPRSAERLDPRRLEPDLGVALGVEEVRRAQVRVAVGLPRVDARHLHGPERAGVRDVGGGD